MALWPLGKQQNSDPAEARESAPQGQAPLGVDRVDTQQGMVLILCISFWPLLFSRVEQELYYTPTIASSISVFKVFAPKILEPISCKNLGSIHLVGSRSDRLTAHVSAALRDCGETNKAIKKKGDYHVPVDPYT